MTGVPWWYWGICGSAVVAHIWLLTPRSTKIIDRLAGPAARRIRARKTSPGPAGAPTPPPPGAVRGEAAGPRDHMPSLSMAAGRPWPPVRIWWYQRACGCEYFRHGQPCWQPCGLHLLFWQQARRS